MSDAHTASDGTELKLTKKNGVYFLEGGEYTACGISFKKNGNYFRNTVLIDQGSNDYPRAKEQLVAWAEDKLSKIQN